MMAFKLPDILVDAPLWWRVVEMAIFLGVTFFLGYLMGRSKKTRIKENIPVRTSSLPLESYEPFQSPPVEEEKIEKPLFEEPERQMFTEPASTERKDDKPDDLTVIDGIGPKLASILNQNGIHSFKDLSRTSSLTLRKILDEEGPQFKVHDPTYWPRQASLAHEGEWNELNKYQSGLHK